MSEEERTKWDKRYGEGTYQPRTWPSPFLLEWLPQFNKGRALDIACGTGRNALALAEAGFEVEAVDISEIALNMGRAEAEKRGLELEWSATDIDEISLAPGRYSLITVIRYRNTSLWPKLIDALSPGGWLLAEHHFKTEADVEGPSNNFRLDPQELLKAFGSLRIVFYQETVTDDKDDHRYALQRLVACNGDPGF